MLCQDDILKRAAILDAGQEGAVKVSCCFLPSPEILHVFLIRRSGTVWSSREPSEKLVINLRRADVTTVILGSSGSFI